MNILAIESAVADGSMALLHNGGPAKLHNGNGAARAERILPIVSKLLDDAGISKHQLDLIAVSTGPGSYSGIRIGMATALGLRDALGIPCVGISVLTAMASAFREVTRRICAVPVGKNDIGWQLFDSDPTADAAPPQVSSFSTFVTVLSSHKDSTLFAPDEVLVRVKARLHECVCFDAGTNLAEYIGQRAATSVTTAESMHPIYLRNQDGPARAF
jgi:tRNA threonylcarbamoyl adenosine modification protein YeaZ